MNTKTPIFRLDVTLDLSRISCIGARIAFLKGTVIRRTLPGIRLDQVEFNGIEVCYLPPQKGFSHRKHKGLLVYQYTPEVWEKFKDVHVPLTKLECVKIC